MSLFSGGVLTVIGILLVPQIKGLFFKEAPSLYLYLTIPLVTFMLIQENLSFLLLGRRKIAEFNFIRIYRTFSYLCVLVLLLYVMKLGTIGPIWANIFAVATTVVVVLVLMIKSGYGISISFHGAIFLSTLKFGLKGHLGTLFQYLNYRLDILIVAYFLPLSSVGLYEVAVLLAEMIWYIPNSISQILLAKISSTSKSEADKFTPLVSRHTFYLTLVASVLLLIVSEPLILLLFTPRFASSILVFRLLLPGIIALSIWKILINDLTGRGYPEYRTYTTGISVIVTVILDLILIPKYGIAGAAVATSIAYGIAFVMALFWFIKISGTEIRDLFLLRIEDIRYYGQVFKILQSNK